MDKLRLKFTDVSGENAEVTVDKERFTVGRHSECDLSIVDVRLSREHLLIEWDGTNFTASDRNSSNGTKLNGVQLVEPLVLNNGDALDLGGFQIEVELQKAPSPAPTEAENAKPLPTATPVFQNQATAPVEEGLPKSVLVIAALAAFLILVVLGVFVILSLRNSSDAENDNFVVSEYPDGTPVNRKTPEPRIWPTPVNVPPSNGEIASNNGNGGTLPKSIELPAGDATEKNAAAFLRKIAQNDPKAFVTGEQAALISSKIKSVSGSSALADNIVSAGKNAAAIKSLAASKNLKPQFLAVAAITTLGGSRGDVLQTAQKMADTLDKLGTQIGSEFGDDCLLMMAAYDQGDPLKMRNMLQDLANRSSESTRTIRTIWYLKKNGKITDSEYDFALRFLAIGTIVQNPADFGVKTGSLNF